MAAYSSRNQTLSQNSLNMHFMPNSVTNALTMNSSRMDSTLQINPIIPFPPPALNSMFQSHVSLPNFNHVRGQQGSSNMPHATFSSSMGNQPLQFQQGILQRPPSNSTFDNLIAANLGFHPQFGFNPSFSTPPAVHLDANHQQPSISNFNSPMALHYNSQPVLTSNFNPQLALNSNFTSQPALLNAQSAFNPNFSPQLLNSNFTTPALNSHLNPDPSLNSSFSHPALKRSFPWQVRMDSIKNQNLAATRNQNGNCSRQLPPSQGSVNSNNKNRKIKPNFLKQDDIKKKSFSCDVCDRAYSLRQELDSHLSEHIKCRIKQCKFEAHPKIVALHQKMQHDTGYADVISKLTDADEVEKWRQARRRNFPTTENIKKRKAEQTEKEDRGEVLQTKDFGKFKKPRAECSDYSNRGARNRSGRGSRGCRRYRNQHKTQNTQGKREIVNVEDSDSDADDHISLQKFKGLSSLCNSVSSTFATEQVNLEDHSLRNECLQVVNNLIDEVIHKHELFKLECTARNDKTDQGHDAKECSPNLWNAVIAVNCISGFKEDEAPTAKPIEKNTQISPADMPAPPHETGFEEDEAPIVEPIKKTASLIVPANMSKSNLAPSHEKNKAKNENLNSNNQRNAGKNIHTSQNSGAAFNTRKSTLLEKLLADDIRHERNIILQCVRHIVKNNFYGIGTESNQ